MNTEYERAKQENARDTGDADNLFNDASEFEVDFYPKYSALAAHTFRSNHVENDSFDRIDKQIRRIASELAEIDLHVFTYFELRIAD